MKSKILIMTSKKNLAAAIMHTEKIDDFDEIISQNANITKKSLSHIVFDTQPANPDEITHDITFFQIEGEDESVLEEKLNDLIGKLDELHSDYTLRDEDTGKMIVALDFVGMLKIKLDNLEIIKKGTYKEIDELKHTETEFGYCKGYKPDFRPIEGKPIEHAKIEPEKIFLFSDSRENITKLSDYLSEKVMEIDSGFEVEYIAFT